LFASEAQIGLASYSVSKFPKHFTLLDESFRIRLGVVGEDL
jgi:hypothetical protein